MTQEEQQQEEERQRTVIPKVALRWILLHATNSNVELARLSNVNRSWRDVVTTVILEQATLKAKSSTPLLLLPSMAAQLVRRENSNSNAATEITTENATTTTSGETFCAAWFAPEGIQLLDLDEEQQGSSDDDDSSSSSDDYNDNQRNNPRQGMHRHCRHSSANSGAGGTGNPKKSKHARSKSPMMMTIQRRAPRLEQIPQHQTWGRGHGLAVKPSFEDQGILVSHEWRGYRHAMEILHPFGYAEIFVQHVLQRAQDNERSREIVNEQKNNNLMVDVSDSINRVRQDEAEPLNVTTDTTIAVRGATIARPEGYCLCWDARMAREKQQLAQQNGNNTNDTMVQTIKWQERQRKLKQWKEWRRQLQLTVLPQVLVRRPPHSNAVIQFLNSDEKHAVRFLTPQFHCGPIGEPVTIIIVGIATEDGCFCSGRSHKFELGHLYPNSSLAELAEMSPICMATDSWECCNLPAVTTTSTASGASVSGAVATVISPTASSDRRSPLEQHLASDSDDDSDNDDDDNDDDGDDDDDDEFSSDSSSELAGNHRVPPHKKRGWLHNCTCIFHDNSNPCGFGTTRTSSSTKPSNQQNNRNGNKTTMQPQQNVEREDSQTLREEDEDDDEDDEDNDKESHDAEQIIRGSRIPGMWHCYTAIFDGKQSVIRVDGVPEVLKTTTSKKSSSSTPKRSRRPMLDGLTIGSDHCFDMTLCFGQGSGGEGEGAIAEIAVFGGRLDTVDLEVLERQLMRKHGIPIPKLTREALVQEDDWTRKAHALYCQLPPEAAAAQLRQTDAGKPLAFNQGNSIPLRVMAKHRSVAWHQFNAVTGEELRIKRIGSRSAGSSSDW